MRIGKGQLEMLEYYENCDRPVKTLYPLNEVSTSDSIKNTQKKKNQCYGSQQNQNHTIENLHIESDSPNNQQNPKNCLFSMNKDLDENPDYLEYFTYNNYLTLRKSSAKLLEKISMVQPQEVFFIIKPNLEVELQNEYDWINK